MRKSFPAAICTGLLAAACNIVPDRAIPTFPSRAGAPTAPAPPPPVAFAEPYTQITVGEVVSGRVVAGDPLCAGFPEFRCQYFRLTVPRDGTLDVAITTIRSVWYLGLDISVTYSTGGEYWGPVGGQATLAVRAGATHQITVWYAEPGDEFELRSFLRAE